MTQSLNCGSYTDKLTELDLDCLETKETENKLTEVGLDGLEDTGTENYLVTTL